MLLNELFCHATALPSDIEVEDLASLSIKIFNEPATVTGNVASTPSFSACLSLIGSFKSHSAVTTSVEMFAV